MSTEYGSTDLKVKNIYVSSDHVESRSNLYAVALPAKVFGFLGLLIAAVVVSLALSKSTLKPEIASTLFVKKVKGIYTSTTSTNSVDLDVIAYNEYGDTSAGKASYPFLADSILLEPSRDNSINITSISDGCKYDWVLTGPSELPVGDQYIYSGSTTEGSLVVAPKTVGTYSLSISESCSGSDERTLAKKAYVKYVRRELSTLTNEDREAFLDAFATLWTVNTVDGKELFGDSYKSLFYFATLHNDGGANSVCDEFHGGLGFVNDHLYLSAFLEQSLQLVNPKVALHYMEYTEYFSSDAFNDRKF